MSEVLDDMPVVLTKDAKWAETVTTIEVGSVVVLPDDAVLVKAPPKESES